MGVIRNLKYDTDHNNKPRSAYKHLEFLDSVMDVEKAERIQAYEMEKYGKHVTLKIEKVKKPKESKNEVDG
jgi:hypothetical protein